MNYRRQITTVCLLVFLFGLIAIIGWILRVPILTSTIPGYPTLKFNTAICFILSATALFLSLNKRSQVLIMSISAVLIFIAGLTLSQDLFDVNFGLDELIINDDLSPLPVGGVPGRMANATAVCFVLLGVAFLFLQQKPTKGLGQNLLHIVTFISFTSIIAYIFLVPVEMRPWMFATMSLNTSISHLLLSMGGSLLNPSMGRTKYFTGQKLGNRIASAVFVALIATSLIIGLFLVYLITEANISLQFGIAIFIATFITIGMFLVSTMATEINEGRNILSQFLSKRKHVEMSIKSIIDTTPAALIAMNAKGIITLVNKQAEEAFGYAKDELLNQSIAMLIPDELKTALPPYLNLPVQSLSDGNPNEYYLLGKAGQKIPVKVGLEAQNSGQSTIVFLKTS